MRQGFLNSIISFGLVSVYLDMKVLELGFRMTKVNIKFSFRIALHKVQKKEITSYKNNALVLKMLFLLKSQLRIIDLFAVIKS